MKRRKWEPLTREQEIEICTKCNGFCCRYYFNNPGIKKNIDFYKFRGRPIVRYGNTYAVLMQDICIHSDAENHKCVKLEHERFPEVCKEFPSMYRPFWNLRCKLMRERYKRGMIPKDNKSFNKLYSAIPSRKNKKYTGFKFYNIQG